jgi:hypothetical protein
MRRNTLTQAGSMNRSSSGIVLDNQHYLWEVCTYLKKGIANKVETQAAVVLTLRMDSADLVSSARPVVRQSWEGMNWHIQKGVEWTKKSLGFGAVPQARGGNERHPPSIKDTRKVKKRLLERTRGWRVRDSTYERQYAKAESDIRHQLVAVKLTWVMGPYFESHCQITEY